MAKCFFCQCEFDPEIIVEIPVVFSGSETIHYARKVKFPDGTVATMCQHCLAMSLYVESRISALGVNYVKKPDFHIATPDEVEKEASELKELYLLFYLL